MMPQPTDPVHPHLASDSKENADSPSEKPLNGTVYLVGAGPGDPRLITLRGIQCLQRADVVLYDGLANPQLLEFAASAEHISVGKHGESPIWTQSAINNRMVELALSGKTVARLKGGDPAVFARTAEELAVLAEREIPFEVVPGITAALAAASYVGIPITHRDHASAVAFITGQQQRGGVPQEIDWEAVARFPGTLVFYMGVTTVKVWAGQLIQAGKDPETPVAVVRRCTWNDQSVRRCRLGDVRELLIPASKMRPPVIVIIGDVAALGEDFDWYSQQPLHGCGVLITRPAGQATGLTDRLMQLGAHVYHQPCIQTQLPHDSRQLEECIHSLAEAAERGRSNLGVTFSSSNGVQRLMQKVSDMNLDSRIFSSAKLAAVGPATAKALRSYGLRADILPSNNEYSANALLESIREAKMLSAENDGHAEFPNRWYVTTTNTSRGALQRGLKELGATVCEVLTYETHPVNELQASVASALAAGRIHICTATSAAIAGVAKRILGAHSSTVAPVALSEAIAQRLRELEWPAQQTACENSDEALVNAISAAWTEE